MLLDHDFESIFPQKLDSVTIGGTTYPGALNLPSGSTATRTSTPVAGSFRWNSQLVALEFYDGAQWSSPVVLTSQPAKTVLAAPIGAAGIPTFRLQGLGEHSDVTLTSPTATQVLSYTGTQWINSSVLAGNAAGLIGVSNSSGGSAWSQVGTSTRYTATFTHSLGTQNIVVTVYDTIDNSIVIPDKVVGTDANTVTVTVVGNTKTLKVVVVANGSSIVSGGSTPSAVITAYQGITVSSAATKLNFIGSALVTDAGGGTTNISIGARFTSYANSLDTPNNADWAVNAFAPIITDPTNTALNVRQFSGTIEQGVGYLITVPAGATQGTLKFRIRAGTAPATASTVQFKMYSRQIPNNSAVPAWSAGTDLTVISMPLNAYFQYVVQTFTLAALGLTAGNTFQIEVTRKVTPSSGTQLSGVVLLSELTSEFT